MFDSAQTLVPQGLTMVLARCSEQRAVIWSPSPLALAFSGCFYRSQGDIAAARQVLSALATMSANAWPGLPRQVLSGLVGFPTSIITALKTAMARANL